MSKKIISQTTRVLTCLLLLVALSFVSITAHAAGTENWDKDYGPIEGFRMKDTNLTPVKTITKTGTLSIKYVALPCREGHLSDCTEKCKGKQEKHSFSPITVTVQIRDANTGKVLSKSSSNEYRYNTVSYKVTKKGTKVRIFFDVSTQAGEPKPGPTRVAHIKYNYKFE